MMRLDKYLSNMGLGTRSEVKKDISKGIVKINGSVITKSETKLDPHKDKVMHNEVPVSYSKNIYYMLNKPSGILSATKDHKSKTVIDLIASKRKASLFPIGRLDKDTEGLLIITNDGILAHNLLSPVKHVDKKYKAKITGRLSCDDINSLEQGLNIGTKDTPEITMPSRIEILEEYDDFSIIYLTIQEGKYHQVKRMIGAVGQTVIYLKRVSMGALHLDEKLAPGEYRELSPDEVDLLK
ncbi:MAG: pseudouridine synthase [Suipraeoptans sp.]